MKDWKIVKSKSGKSEDGFPIPEILCRNITDIEKAIEIHEIHDPVITDYEDKGLRDTSYSFLI